MICAKPDCKFGNTEDQMVACWLCYTAYHAKCVQLSARTVDNLKEDKGLRWCCKKCKIFDIEFYTFFKNTRMEFDKISTDLTLLTEKFHKYKDVFDNASCLEKFLQSPSDSIRKRKKTSENLNIIPEADLNQNLHPTTLCTTPTNIPNPEIPALNQSQSYAPSIVINAPPHNKTSTNIAATSKGADSTPSGTNKFFTPTASPNNIVRNKELRVVPSQKTIFIARFAADTSTDDITDYIRSNLKLSIDIKVFKFKYSEQRSKASFKVIVPEDYFDAIVNPDFWPPKAIVHEYIYRDNGRSNIVHLPSRNNEISKN